MKPIYHLVVFMLESRHENCLGNNRQRSSYKIAKVPWALEQPASSMMLHVPQLLERFRSGMDYTARFDWCQFGRTWRKTTVVRGRWPFLPSLSRACQGGHSHVWLEGALTKQGGEYSESWCQEVAQRLTVWVPDAVRHLTVR